MEFELNAMTAYDKEEPDLENMISIDPKVEFVNKSKIGNISCYYYKADGIPRIFIGPDWYFFIVILFLTFAFCGINIGVLYQMSQLQY